MRTGELENEGGCWVECENENEEGGDSCCFANKIRGWVL